MGAEDIVKKFQSAFVKGDIKVLSELYDVNATLHHPLVPQPLKGRTAIAEFEGAMFDAFSAITWKPTKVVVQGDTVAVQFSVGGKNTGPIRGPGGGMPATNKVVDLPAAIFLRLNSKGLIAEEHRYFNPGVMFQQLGIKAG